MPKNKSIVDVKEAIFLEVEKAMNVEQTATAIPAGRKKKTTSTSNFGKNLDTKFFNSIELRTLNELNY